MIQLLINYYSYLYLILYIFAFVCFIIFSLTSFYNIVSLLFCFFFIFDFNFIILFVILFIYLFDCLSVHKLLIII